MGENPFTRLDQLGFKAKGGMQYSHRIILPAHHEKHICLKLNMKPVEGGLGQAKLIWPSWVPKDIHGGEEQGESQDIVHAVGAVMAGKAEKAQLGRLRTGRVDTANFVMKSTEEGVDVIFAPALIAGLQDLGYEPVLLKKYRGPKNWVMELVVLHPEKNETGFEPQPKVAGVKDGWKNEGVRNFVSAFSGSGWGFCGVFNNAVPSPVITVNFDIRLSGEIPKDKVQKSLLVRPRPDGRHELVFA